MKKTKFTSKSSGGIKPMLLGALVIWSAFLVLSLAFAVVLFSGDDPTRSSALFSLIAFILSGAVGTAINKKISLPEKNTALLSALVTALVYLCVSAVVSGRISFGAIISAACFMGASAIVGIPKKKKAKKHGHRA